MSPKAERIRFVHDRRCAHLIVEGYTYSYMDGTGIETVMSSPIYTFQPATFESYNQLISGLRDVGEELQNLIGDIVPQLLSIDMEGLKIDGPFQVEH